MTEARPPPPRRRQRFPPPPVLPVQPPRPPGSTPGIDNPPVHHGVSTRHRLGVALDKLAAWNFHVAIQKKQVLHRSRPRQPVAHGRSTEVALTFHVIDPEKLLNLPVDLAVLFARCVVKSEDFKAQPGAIALVGQLPHQFGHILIVNRYQYRNHRPFGFSIRFE